MRNPYEYQLHDRSVANISVIATSREGTQAAFWTAAELAAQGAARLCLFVRAGQTGLLPRASSLNGATVLIYSGREEDLVQLIPRPGLVVVGGSGGLWWPTPEQQLARKLARLGYRVIFALSDTSRSVRETGVSARSCVSSSGET